MARAEAQGGSSAWSQVGQADLEAAFEYMAQSREPYLLATSVWTLVNWAGGGDDPAFEGHALFTERGPTQAVAAIKALAARA